MQNRASSVEKGRLITRRVFMLAAAKLILLGGITSRLYSLQISDREKYELLSDKNRIREWKTPPQRGFITDHFNNVLADNDRVFQVHLDLDQIQDFNDIVFKLKNILGLSNNELKKIYREKERLKPWDILVASDNLSWTQFSKLNLYLHELEGVKPVVSSSRFYPYKDDLVHVVGYVGAASQKDIERDDIIKENLVPGLKVGKSGIEFAKEHQLIGRYGIKRYEVNSSGKRISQIDHIKETQGEKIKLTVDLEVQQLAQELLKGKAGSISAMDIYTGEIIAMASSPTYDPNKFTHGIGHKDWGEIRDDPLKPLVNKSIAGLYSPGSTFKPLVALAALEFGTIDPERPILCKGHKHPYELYGVKYHCWKKNGHGYMKLRNAIKQSCDIYFYEMARLLGVDRLAIIAKRYGLGSNILKDLYFDEKKGVVPNTFWKKNAIGKSWYLGETVINGIGQGYIQTTPLQLCLMTAQIANGGYKIKPHIIQDESITYENVKLKIANQFINSPLNLSEEDDQKYLVDREYRLYERLYKDPRNINFVKDAMFGSTNEQYGTSYKSRYDDIKYQYAGKTGTSQVKRITEEERKLDLDQSQIEYKNRDHALFVAFAPYKNPRYAISVLVEHGGSGSSAAAPLASKLIKKIVDRHKLRDQIKNGSSSLA
ncbi:penicillin-binding protein 2 [Candidatus Pelagibacter sp.]|nr:penicillin-binding protein 2 [Candidatus Pelagibacter sp.]